MRATPSQIGWMPPVLSRPDPSWKVCQLSMKPTSFAGRHFDSQWLNVILWLNISSLVRLSRGPEKTTESHSVLVKAHTDSTLTVVTSSCLGASGGGAKDKLLSFDRPRLMGAGKLLKRKETSNQEYIFYTAVFGL